MGRGSHLILSNPPFIGNMKRNKRLLWNFANNSVPNLASEVLDAIFGFLAKKRSGMVPTTPSESVLEFGKERKRAAQERLIGLIGPSTVKFLD